jgi:hypothetical protein
VNLPPPRHPVNLPPSPSRSLCVSPHPRDPQKRSRRRLTPIRAAAPPPPSQPERASTSLPRGLHPACPPLTVSARRRLHASPPPVCSHARPALAQPVRQRRTFCFSRHPMKLSPPPPSTSALLLLPLRDRSRPHAWQAKHGRLGFQNPSTPSYNFYRWCPRGLSTPISFVRAPLGRTFSRSTGHRPRRRRPCRSPTRPCAAEVADLQFKQSVQRWRRGGRAPHPTPLFNPSSAASGGDMGDRAVLHSAPSSLRNGSLTGVSGELRPSFSPCML